MKSNFKPVLAAVTVAMLLLAGCTRLPGRAENEQGQHAVGQEDIGASLHQEIGKAADSLQQTVEETAGKVKEHIKINQISKQVSSSAAINSSSILIIDNPVGEIEARPAAGKELTAQATIWFDNRAIHESNRNRILEQAQVFIETDGDKVRVSVQAKDEPGKDLWVWAEDTMKYSDFSIDYMIGLPEGVDTYEITNDVGAIRLSDLKGTYHIASNVGEIHISSGEFTGSSSVTTDTGSIQLEVADMQVDSRLTAKTDVGSLKATLADSLKCSLDTNSELGVISGAPDGKSDMNGGGPLISLTSSIGAITVNKS